MFRYMIFLCTTSIDIWRVTSCVLLLILSTVTPSHPHTWKLDRDGNRRVPSWNMTPHVVPDTERPTMHGYDRVSIVSENRNKEVTLEWVIFCISRLKRICSTLWWSWMGDNRWLRNGLTTSNRTWNGSRLVIVNIVLTWSGLVWSGLGSSWVS